MNHWLHQWVPFLVGTPKRTLVTLGVLCAVLLAAKPRLGEILANNLMTAVSPFLQMAMLVGVLVLGFRYLFKRSGSSSSAKKK